jgi:hypothetical protein
LRRFVLVAATLTVVAALGPRSQAADTKPAASPKPSAAKAVVASPSPSPSAAPATGKAAEQEKALRERVSQYWGFRATTNLHACYPFYEVAFRTKYTADQFAVDFRRLNRFAPEFLGVDSVAIDPSGTKAKVKLKLRTHPDVLQGQELISPIEDSWLLEDGVWNKASELTFPNI